MLWWTSNFEHQTKQIKGPGPGRMALAPDYDLWLMEGLPYSSNISPRRYLHYKRLASQFSSLARLERVPDVILASMPDYDLAHEAYLYGAERGVPVMVDVRDLWPDIFLQVAPAMAKPVLRLMLSGDYKRLRRLFGGAQSITAVSRGYLDWACLLGRRNPRAQDRVFYHGYPDPLPLGPNSEDSGIPWLSDLRGKVVFTFVGSFGAHYDLDLLVEAAKLLSEHDKQSVHFVLAGDGDKMPRLREAVRRLPNLTLTGWLNQEKIRTLLAASHVGLAACLHPPDTLPNKPFEYLAYGLPLLSSLRGEMEEIIERYKLGYSYASGDLEGFLQLVGKLADSPSLRENLSANAKRAYETEFRAASIYKGFCRHIEEVVRGHRAARGAVSKQGRSAQA
ncbi:MAG TPA: glycosyltransferase family 4 protein [Bacillota bacterium]|nr:glycosyltransferase family 4 protein [Bacillota bacterium]